MKRKPEGERRKKFFYRVDVADLFLRDLHGAQTLLRILIEHGVHGGRFARALVAVQEHIRIRQPAQKADGVVLHGAFFFRIIFQIGERDVGGVLYGPQGAVFVGERLVPDKNAVAVPAVEVLDARKRLLRVPVFPEQGIVLPVQDARHPFGGENPSAMRVNCCSSARSRRYAARMFSVSPPPNALRANRLSS